TIRIRVTATNAAGSTSASSGVSAIVASTTSGTSGTTTPPTGTSGGNGNGNGNGNANRGGANKRDRLLAAVGTPKLEWEGRLFVSATEFRRYLSARGVAW